jgi:hypothetical protein
MNYEFTAKEAGAFIDASMPKPMPIFWHFVLPVSVELVKAFDEAADRIEELATRTIERAEKQYVDDACEQIKRATGVPTKYFRRRVEISASPFSSLANFYLNTRLIPDSGEITHDYPFDFPGMSAAEIIPHFPSCYGRVYGPTYELRIAEIQRQEKKFAITITPLTPRFDKHYALKKKHAGLEKLLETVKIK